MKLVHNTVIWFYPFGIFRLFFLFIRFYGHNNSEFEFCKYPISTLYPFSIMYFFERFWTKVWYEFKNRGRKFLTVRQEFNRDIWRQTTMALSFGWVKGVWNIHFGNMFFIIRFLIFLKLAPVCALMGEAAVSETKVMLSFSLNLNFFRTNFSDFVFLCLCR
jgi:hypothetical protein